MEARVRDRDASLVPSRRLLHIYHYKKVVMASILLKNLETPLYHRVFFVLTSVPFWMEGAITESNRAAKRPLYP